MLTDKSGATALSLLRQALEPLMKVRELGRPSANEPVTVEISGPGQPAQRLRLIPWARHDRHARHRGIVWVLRRSEASAATGLMNRDESFVDLRGRVRLVTPRLYVDRSDLRPRATLTNTRFFDPFADRASLVARAMLEHDRSRAWTARELARITGVSPDTASIVLRQLEARGVVRVDRAGRSSRATLISARRLIEQWTEAYRWENNTMLSVHAPIGSPSSFLQRLGRQVGRRRWALTMQAGASYVAPHAAWDKLHVYVDASDKDELMALAAEHEWKPAAEGRLVIMRPYYEESVWRNLREEDGIKIVSMTQLILDLWHYPLRGREQAEHLLELYLAGQRNG